jgi:hypothetical protein
MKKVYLFLLLSLTVLNGLVAQENGTNTSKKKIDLSNRPNDHLVIQFGYSTWSGVPDTIAMGKFSKSFNIYFMFDFPFKSNPKMSLGAGVGVGSDHIRFSKVNVGIKELGSTLRFTNVRDTNHYKKTKLATSYAEVPLELRYSANPETGKGIKFGLGVRVGALINAHTRNVDWENRNGNLLNEFSVKESSTKYFNKTRFVGTFRVGYGNVSLFSSYQLNPTLRDGQGPTARPFTLGLTLSGL